MILVQAATPQSGTPIWVVVIVAVGGAAITAVTTYLINRRTSSGRIDTTEAATLWEEARSVRQELRAEVVQLRSDIKDSQEKVDRLEDQHLQCLQESNELRTQVADLTQQVKLLERRRQPRR